jgi:tetratricopeptide (TPR) repeat protein
VYLMLAALENVQKPQEAATARAIKALEDGLKTHAGDIELVAARYKLLKGSDPSTAISWLEAQATPQSAPAVRRLLAESYRDRGDFAKAELVVRELLQDQPKDQPRDPALVALLVRVLLSQAAVEAERGGATRERATDEKTLALVRQAKAEFPSEIAFPRAEWELAMRRRDFARALAITQEVDTIAPRSTLGPVLRAQVFASQGRVPEVAQSYAEASEREPRRLDLKLLLAQTQLTLGKTDECLRLASNVLEADKDQPGAVVLKARALIAFEGPASQVNVRRDEAAALLTDAIKADPKFREAYHTLADLEQRRGRRAEAVKTLEADLKADPDDVTGLALLAQALTAPRDGKPAAAADLARAKALAEEQGGRDAQGQKCLALAIGFQRAQQLEMSIPWARKAVERIQTPAVHQTCGDILLARAEQFGNSDQSRELFRQAIAEYDEVLKVQPTAVEAVNNKAWILHRYLNDNATALELVEALVKRIDPSTLPPEFLDTLGAIQETANRVKDAEDSYNAGLRKAPRHPFLNFHLGRLIAADSDRRSQALPYLQIAQATSDRLPPSMAAELKELIQSATR